MPRSNLYWPSFSFVSSIVVIHMTRVLKLPHISLHPVVYTRFANLSHKRSETLCLQYRFRFENSMTIKFLRRIVCFLSTNLLRTARRRETFIDSENCTKQSAIRGLLDALGSGNGPLVHSYDQKLQLRTKATRLHGNAMFLCAKCFCCNMMTLLIILTLRYIPMNISIDQPCTVKYKTGSLQMYRFSFLFYHLIFPRQNHWI